jgi:hypothetical protein
MAFKLLKRPFDLTARETLLALLGAAIAQLLIMTGDRIFGREYRDALLLSGTAAALAFIFFRRRKIALALSGLSWVLVLAALTVPFHPSLLAWALTIGSAAGLYFTIRWSYKRYPYLSYKNRRAVFEGEAAMAAENARIEAEARELAKRRPYGPWLFR